MQLIEIIRPYSELGIMPLKVGERIRVPDHFAICLIQRGAAIPIAKTPRESTALFTAETASLPLPLKRLPQ